MPIEFNAPECAMLQDACRIVSVRNQVPEHVAAVNAACLGAQLGQAGTDDLFIGICDPDGLNAEAFSSISSPIEEN